MPRGRHRSARSSGRKPTFSWHGSYLATAQTPADVLVDFHVLYDPRETDGENEADVTVYRVVGNGSIRNVSTSANLTCGFGIYLVEQSALGAITTDVDPIAITRQDIEVNNLLYHRIDLYNPTPVDDIRDTIRWELDTTVRRRIQGRHMLVLAIRGDVASAWQYEHRLRVLIREGTR